NRSTQVPAPFTGLPLPLGPLHLTPTDWSGPQHQPRDDSGPLQCAMRYAFRFHTPSSTLGTAAPFLSSSAPLQGAFLPPQGHSSSSVSLLSPKAASRRELQLSWARFFYCSKMRRPPIIATGEISVTGRECYRKRAIPGIHQALVDL